MIQRTLAGVALVVALGVTGVSSDDKKKASPRRIDIAVTEAGFEPKKVTVKTGEEVTLAFT